jgi:hypothetical protein
MAVVKLLAEFSGWFASQRCALSPELRDSKWHPLLPPPSASPGLLQRSLKRHPECCDPHFAVWQLDNSFNMASTVEDPSSSSSSQASSTEGSIGHPSPPDSPIVNGHSRSPHKNSNSNGPKYKLLHEGDIQLCRLNHTRTIVSKIMNSKYLRRWESHHLVLGQSEIYSHTVSLQLLHVR